MIQATAHQKFLLIVQTAAIVKDIQMGQQKAAFVVAHVMDIDAVVFNDYEEDMASLAGMGYEYVSWQYGEKPRPTWITFYNGPFTVK